MAEPPPANRELRGGRYAVFQQLGQGAQGTTWDAIDKREGRPVAIKEFDVRGARAWKDVELAEREARVLSGLDHPMLPHYVEHFEEDGALFLVMEKMDGTPLSVLQKKGPRLTEKDAVRLLSDVDQLFEYLHTRNPPVIHRDIKPSNIIRRSNGTFSVVDFGAVRDKLRPGGGSTVVGTFGYMAPEQFQGRAGPGSDVYAMGATVLSMLTGEEPENLPHKGLAVDVKAALGDQVSPRLVLALSRKLEPDPDLRAKRIAPLLEPERAPARPQERQRRPNPARQPWSEDRQEAWRALWDIDEGTRISRRVVRRAQREARKRARRAERHARRAERRGRNGGAPFPINIIVGLALFFASSAVKLATQVVVPLVLTMLSLVFGESLRRAARDVQAAGEEADEALDNARAHVQGDDPEKSQRPGSADAKSLEDPRVRVADAPKRAPAATGTVRVEAPEEEPIAEDDREDQARRMRRR